MTHFPRQLAVAVVVLFAFTFLSGCGKDANKNEPKKDDPNKEEIKKDDVKNSGDPKPNSNQPNKKTCTLEGLETNMKADGILLEEKCRKKGAMLKVNDECEFECKDSENYEKTGHIRCGKDKKIDNTAECNPTDEKTKADEEVKYKRSIAQLLITIVESGNERAVKRFIETKEWNNIKAIYNELDRDGEELRKLKKDFDKWDIETKKDEAKRNIVNILVRILPKYKRSNIKQWVYEALHSPIPIEKRLMDADASTKAAAEKECKKEIDKFLDIHLLSRMMVKEIGHGVQNEQRGEIEAYLRSWRGLRKAAKDIRDAAGDKAREDPLVKKDAKSYCVYQMMKGMKDSEKETDLSLEKAFKNYLENIEDLPSTYRQVMADTVSHKYLKKYTSDKIQKILKEEELEEKGIDEARIEEFCYNDVLNEPMRTAIKAATDVDGQKEALKSGAEKLVRSVLKERIRETTQCHSDKESFIDDVVNNGQGLQDAVEKIKDPEITKNFVHDYVLSRLKNIAHPTHPTHHADLEAYVKSKSIPHLRPILQKPATDDDPLLREFCKFADGFLRRLVEEDHGKADDKRTIKTKSKKDSLTYVVETLNGADKIKLLKLEDDKILENVDKYA